MNDWFESEDFWTNYGPIMYDDNLWNEAPTVAEYIKKIAGLKKGATVLDAACGVGRISIELAALGFDVTGVDITKSVLEAAKESALAENVSLSLINDDLRYFKSEKKFDCVINLYTSFGYCNSISEDLQILKNMCDCVKPDGTFVMECLSRETAALYWNSGEEFERAGVKVVTKFTVEGAWEGLKSRWILYPKETDLEKNPDAKPLFDHTYTQRLYTASFLRDKLLEYGFSKAEIFGDFDYSPYNEKARTMILIGKK